MTKGSLLQKCQGQSLLQIQNKAEMSFEDQLNQILGLSNLVKQQQDHCVMDKSLQISREKSDSLQTIQVLPQQIPSVQKKSKIVRKSNHHNLQKHTVTALKSLINQQLFLEYSQNQQLIPIVKQLWSQFLTIKRKQIMTKKFLSILYRHDIESVQLLKQYGFENIFKIYSQNEIKLAKNQLRKLTIKFMNDKLIQSHVQNRQIQKKDQFKIYLKEFRTELECDNIKKRISKISSIRMKQILGLNTL